MGKKRTAVIGETKETKKKVMFKWEEAYQDLSPDAASVLKDARVKPDQLAAMADGEILALPRMNPQFLEEIRKNYPAQLQDLETKPEQKEAVAAAPVVEAAKPASDSPVLKHPRHRFGRSKRYKALVVKVENKAYESEAGVELLKQISYSALKTVELHLNVREAGIRGELSLPFSVGKEIKVAIFSPEVAEKVKAGKIEFDILLARPTDMPQIAPLAKVLGPRGLMPNPKSGTITPNPEERAKQLAAGATLAYKTEPKAPVMHLVIGNLDQKNEELVGNIKTIIAGVGPTRIISAYLKSTMSPAIRLVVA